jgi:hypothetical protein
MEIADLIARGLSNRAIADELVISQTAVARHVADMLTKPGLRLPSAGRRANGPAGRGAGRPVIRQRGSFVRKLRWVGRLPKVRHVVGRGCRARL